MHSTVILRGANIAHAISLVVDVFRNASTCLTASYNEQNSLSPSAKAILDSILETRQDKLIPLDELRLNDFFPNFHPALATEEGHPLHFHDNLARLVIHHEGPKVQE